MKCIRCKTNEAVYCPECVDEIRAALSPVLSDALLLDNVRTLFNVLYDAPELNPSNYDHDEVCDLNAAMCEAFALCRDLLNRVSSNAESEVSE